MKKRTRFAALLMAAALMLTLLAGCGGGPEGDQTTDEPGGYASGLVWVSEFTKVSGINDYISSPAISGDKIYVSMSGYDEATGTWTPSIYAIDLTTGEAAKLEGYTPVAAPEGYDDAYVSINNISAAPDGGIMVSENINATVFNLPEGFNEETDDRYQYAESFTTSTLRHLDATGAELSSIDLTAAQEAAQANSDASSDMYGGSIYLSSFGSDAEGNIGLLYNQSIVVMLSGTGEVLYSGYQEGWWDRFVTLPDGSLAMSGSGNTGYVLRPLDFSAKGFGDDVELPNGAYNIYPGGGEYTVSYIDSSYVYGFKAETGEAVQLASLINCDVNEENINALALTDDGGILCLLFSYDDNSAEIARIVQKDASEVPQTKTLRLACNYLSQDLRRRVLDFNRSNSGVRIEVVDYSQYATEDDYSAGVTKLNTEIISGNVPDLFVADELPIEQYGAKGLLCDLYEFIDSDEELSRDDFFENILTAMESDGKLYSIAPTFGIVSLVGNADVVGEEMGWTLQELMDVSKAHPEAQYLLDPYTTKAAMLQTMLALNLGEYVDWATGECSFNSQDFIDVLNFCNMFPESYDYNSSNQESTPALISSGRQLLASYSASDFAQFQMYEAMFGGHLAFKGFPTSEGIGNVAVPTGSRLSISATCSDPEAAWSFVRTALLEETYPEDRYYYVNGYPLNKASFEKLKAKAMEKQYETDPETGEQVEVSTGGWGWDDFYIDIYAMTEEQAAQLDALIASVDRTYSYDQNIMNLVTEECADFFAGTKTAEQAASLIQDRVSIYVNEQR